MSKTVKYTGTQKRWPELAVTGKQSVWQPGQQDERSDTEANQLLGTGLFTQVYTVNDLPLASLVSGAGRRTQVASKYFGQVQSNAGVLNNTIRGVYEVPFQFVARRHWPVNATAAAQVNRLASSALGSDAAALAGAVAQSPVNFSGVQLHSLPAAISGGGTADCVTSQMPSDWLFEPSVPRTDGGRGALHSYSEYTPSSGNTTGNRADIASTTLAHSVTKVKAYYKAGDCVTSPANFTAPTEWTMAPAVWAEFLTAPMVAEIDIGDSTIQGADSGPMPNVAGAGRLNSELYYGRIAYANFGWASQGSVAYLQNGITAIRALKPTGACFCPWSPNDSDKYTLAGIERMKAGALTFIAECRAAGAIPRLVTPAPMDGIDATQEGFRRQIVEWVKMVCAQGQAVLIDRDATLTNYGSSTGGFKAGLGATTLHPNQVGHLQVVSANWAPVVSV